MNIWRGKGSRDADFTDGADKEILGHKDTRTQRDTKTEDRHKWRSHAYGISAELNKLKYN